MRRALALCLAAVLALSVCCVRIFGDAMKDKEALEFTLCREIGDRSAAEGLQITVREHYDYRLLWESTLFPCEEDLAAETQFTYSDRYIQDRSDWDTWGIDLYKDIYSYNMEPDRKAESGIEKALRELYEQTEPGGYSRRTVALKDLYDYYPLDMLIRLPDITYSCSHAQALYNRDEAWANDPEYYAVTALERFLRIPVLDNEYVDLEITRAYTEGQYSASVGSAWSMPHYVDDEGNYYYDDYAEEILPVEVIDRPGVYVSEDTAPASPEGPAPRAYSPEEIAALTADLDEYQLITFSDAADGRCFFTFDVHTTRGVKVDTSLIPGGYGIYCLPYGYVDQDDYFRYDHYEGWDVFPDQLALFYPLDTDVRILDLSMGPDKEQILLHTAEDGRYLVRSIDAAGGKLLQTLDLGAYDPLEEWSTVIEEDGFQLVHFYSRGFCVLAKDADGLYSIVIRREFTPEEKDMPFWDGRYGSSALDGDRLAVAGEYSILSEDDPWVYHGVRGCGFAAAVYGPEGLRYYCAYGSSLNDANLRQDGKDLPRSGIRPFGDVPVAPQWIPDPAE